MTVSGLIQQALMLMGDMGPGYTASNDVLNTGLETANAMLASWSAEGNMVPFVSANNWTATGAAAVTFGTGGTLNSPRPLKILSARMVVNNVPEPVELVDAVQWAERVDDESAAANYPEILFCDYANPQSTMLLWPTPNSGGVLYLYSLKALSVFAALGDTISMHPGFEHALTYNLAVLLAPKLRRQVPEYVVSVANAAKAGLARLNEEVLRAWTPPEVAQ